MFAEPVAATNFSFLRGASHPADMIERAAELGLAGIGIADRNTVAGVVRAFVPVRDAARDYARENDGATLPCKLMVGARVAFADGTHDVVVYPEDRTGWGRLCRLLTVGNRRTEKGDCLLYLGDLLADPRDLLLILMPERDVRTSKAALARLAEAASGSLWLGAAMHRRGDDRRRLAALKDMAREHAVPLIATNDALYAMPEDRPLQDVVTCIREGLKIENAGRVLEANAERHLKSPQEMVRLFRDAPEAVEETLHLLAR